MTKQHTFSIVAIGLAIVVGGSAPAATVYSNLSGTDTYNAFSGNTVRGANQPFPYSYAVSFTPGGHYTLDSIELGLSKESGGFPDDVIVTLAASDSGLPGATIESFGVFSGFPEFGTSDSFLATAVSAANPLLLAGVEYFVVVDAADPDTSAVWNHNLQGALGRFFEVAPDVWLENPNAQHALRVNGTRTIVPTPSAAATGAALLGLLGLSRRRRPA